MSVWICTGFLQAIEVFETAVTYFLTGFVRLINPPSSANVCMTCTYIFSLQ